MVCPECSAEQMPGTMFCSECGCYLAGGYNLTASTTGADKPTVEMPPRPAAGSLLEAPVGDPAASAAALATESDQAPRQITFVILPHGRRITFYLQKEVRIGRADPEAAVNPELDLTEDGGEELGVSRLHASVHSTDKGVMLVDLASTNGTLLNQEQISPHRRYRVQNGDSIQFGRLLLHIYLS